MSGRNRARGNANQDNDDQERQLWSVIQEKSREVAAMETRSNDIGHEIIEVEKEQAQLLAADKPSSASLDEHLEKLYRENVKLSEDIQHIVEGKDGMSLLESINILAALREHSEASTLQTTPAQPSSQRNASGKLSRVKKGSSSKPPAPAASLPPEDPDDIPAAPSPKILLNPSRLSKDKPSRAGSVSATREASVKLEDGAESVASSADGVASSSALGSGSKASSFGRATNRLVLTKGEIVFCRHSSHASTGPDAVEGEGILCRVTAVIGDGKQRRYEVQDADTSGDPLPPPQRASVSQLIQIPEKNAGLSELGKGRNVLAQYPDTTTFYKAEVVEAWKGGDAEVNLKFEDDDKARGVERRFVLTEK